MTMSDAVQSHSRFVFSRCALGSAERTWFIAEDGPTFRMLQLSAGRWVQKTLHWAAVGVCGRTDPEVELFIVGADGECLVGTAGGFTEEQIDPGAQRPARLGILRDARLIGGVAFAAGMARQVYRRAAPDSWQLISGPIVSENAANCGFNAIDGSSPGRLIAVGLNGEIWRYNDAGWAALDSPTNVSLNRIRQADQQVAFACGQAGTLLEIVDDTVRLLADGDTRQNLHGLAWFRGRLFAASSTRLFVLDRGRLEPVETGLGDALSTGYLEADGHALWSVGPHHLARSFDGTRWELVTCGL
jgi:hypothetical protein